MKKRMIVALITGALLGVVCILGASLRYQGSLEASYLFAFWFNRLMMGFVIGVIDWPISLTKRLASGAIVGLFVSFAFYSATDFMDLTGFLVGAIYGVIIEYLAFRFAKR
jgi:hypothetical protein